MYDDREFHEAGNELEELVDEKPAMDEIVKAVAIAFNISGQYRGAKTRPTD